MSEVKRWEPRDTIVGYDMQPLPYGSFVLAADYANLAQQLAAEKVKNQTLMIELQDKNGALVDLREQLVASQASLSRLNGVQP